LPRRYSTHLRALGRRQVSAYADFDLKAQVQF
jgi:hypothetical protein